MNIEITEGRAGHGWIVHMDDQAVNFNSLEQATAFVDQLKARIEAPHVWPVAAGREVCIGCLSPCALMATDNGRLSHPPGMANREAR
ncbi:hypothetical protein [Pseudomonas gingeri]|uniref:Uncharacterized protein n=1 Tax=Pseudomonas gingeri TaxID=117681 RepID=A0A7Y8CIX1_9PSED|nr:hypothetical protein [Pseudomonas gingeri]NWB29644.1 hypothetical protein [Pseudomonas gingeri]NWC32391.1 hypothetical protein [Pseudomonas gingeri]NWD04735.1 hypothetical protein [Pseudomonas gingeri]NWD48229.1 hypothetical protein [Pseudomonas gingeri]NWE30899.1 hypothetical protein [Pseudomonas gingeri]